MAYNFEIVKIPKSEDGKYRFSMKGCKVCDQRKVTKMSDDEFIRNSDNDKNIGFFGKNFPYIMIVVVALIVGMIFI